jgi:hypothetical protein
MMDPSSAAVTKIAGTTSVMSHNALCTQELLTNEQAERYDDDPKLP